MSYSFLIDLQIVLINMGKCLGKSKEEAQSDETFKRMDSDGSKLVSREEFADYMKSNGLLAQMSKTLELTMNVEEARSNQVAIDVGWKLACTSGSQLTPKQFHAFRSQYVEVRKGNG